MVWKCSGTRGSRQRTPRARSRRPALEQLENRLAPAVFLVDTFQDTPAIDASTGHDASGHVSLRSAVTAANNSPQADNIVLGKGTYNVQAGELLVRGDLNVVGQGAGHTAIETRHLDFLFEAVNGELQLSELTLNGGTRDSLIKGPVKLNNTEITDTVFSGLALALTAAHENTPMPRPLPLETQAPVLPQAAFVLAPVKHLAGQTGYGSSTTDGTLSRKDAHQAFWRIDGELSGEQPADAKPPVEKQDKAAPEKLDEISRHDRHLFIAAAVTEVVETAGTRSIVLSAWAAAPETSLIAQAQPVVDEAVHRAGLSQLTMLLLAAGCASVRTAKKTDDVRSWECHPRRNRTRGRARSSPCERRRPRGPPGNSRFDESHKTNQGRQRCLPCVVCKSKILNRQS